MELTKKEMKLIQNPLVSGSLGIAVVERDYRYLVSPRLFDAKAKGTLGTKEEEGRIIVFNQNNRLVTAKNFLGRLIDVAVWKDRLFITDGLNHRVLIVDKNTLALIGGFGKPGKGNKEFSFPKGIAVGEDGQIYVGDMFNGQIGRASCRERV